MSEMPMNEAPGATTETTSCSEAHEVTQREAQRVQSPWLEMSRAWMTARRERDGDTIETE